MERTVDADFDRVAQVVAEAKGRGSYRPGECAVDRGSVIRGEGSIVCEHIGVRSHPVQGFRVLGGESPRDAGHLLEVHVTQVDAAEVDGDRGQQQQDGQDERELDQ